MATRSRNPVDASPHVPTLLSRLHAMSSALAALLGLCFDTNLDFDDRIRDDRRRDKFIALDQDTAQLVYQLACATNAQNVVEICTSFVINTIYLALAVGRNVQQGASRG